MYDRGVGQFDISKMPQLANRARVVEKLYLEELINPYSGLWRTHNTMDVMLAICILDL